MTPEFVWFLVGVACFLSEFFLPTFVLFFFAIGAWCASAIVAIIDESLTVQLITFLGSALISLFLLRSWSRHIFLGETKVEGNSANMEPVSATGIIVKPIVPPNYGTVKFGGSYWSATAEEPLSESTLVNIVRRKNLLVKVCPVDCTKEKEKMKSGASKVDGINPYAVQKQDESLPDTVQNNFL